MQKETSPLFLWEECAYVCWLVFMQNIHDCFGNELPDPFHHSIYPTLLDLKKRKRKENLQKQQEKKSAKTKQKPPPLKKKKKRTRNLFCMGQLILGMESTVEYG